MIPALVVGGEAIPVLHVSQIAEALGLPPPAPGSALRDARDAAVVLEAWLGHLRCADWETLLRPTRSRGRSLRNLTVNVFHPFELLPDAWATGRFDWRPELDAELEHGVDDRASLAGMAEHALAGWHSFLEAFEHELEHRDPPVSSPRGDVAFSALLSSQRWHAAYHYRQLVDTLEPEQRLDLARFDNLDLPSDLF